MTKSFNKKYLLVLLTMIGCFAFFALAFAALQTAWPDSPMKTKVDKTTNLGQFIKYLYEWGIALGGVATFIAFVIAGFQYITSIGNPTTMKDAIDRIKSAMFGLVLLLSAYVLLNTINPELTSFHLDPFNPVVTDDYFQSCSGSTPCPDGYKCVTYGGKDLCMPDDGKSVFCSDAHIWSNTNFGGTMTTINVDEVIQGTDNVPKSIKARYTDKDYSQACDGSHPCPTNYNCVLDAKGENGICHPKTAADGIKDCDLRTIRDPLDQSKTIASGDKTGCGCILRLFGENKGWLWSSCGDVIRDVPAYEADLTRWADRNIYCVQLLAPGLDKQ